MRYRFISAHTRRWPVRVMCRVLQVSRSGYYAWRSRRPSRRARRNQALLEAIRLAFLRSRATYGSPRIHAELQARGMGCSVNHVAKLMRENSIQPRRRKRYKQTTQVDGRHTPAPNRLERRFAPGTVNQTWAGDITYIPTRDGWCYLAVVLDIGSRRVVGWSVSNRITQRLTLQALETALRRRRPPSGLLHHSDRGGQYAGPTYQRRLRNHGIVCSMSRTGDCWDNAVVESFFSTLKRECVPPKGYPSLAEAKLALFEYIEGYYNRQRRHSTLGYQSPIEYETTIKLR